MSAPNSTSELIKCAEQIQGKDGAAAPLPKSASASGVPEKDKKLKMKKKKKGPQEKGGEPNKQKFSTSLSSEEIENDVFVLTGKRPLRSKIKMDNKVKKDLEDLFLCSSLEGHDADSLRKAYGF